MSADPTFDPAFDRYTQRHEPEDLRKGEVVSFARALELAEAYCDLVQLDAPVHPFSYAYGPLAVGDPVKVTTLPAGPGDPFEGVVDDICYDDPSGAPCLSVSSPSRDLCFMPWQLTYCLGVGWVAACNSRQLEALK